jgi:hypothetical protein
METTKKLNLEAFRSKVKSHQEEDLSKISGGILGACHCWGSQYTVRSSDGVSTVATYTFCVK